MADYKPLVKKDGKYQLLDTADSLDLNTGQKSSILPSQTGNAGKVLTTNGSVASWETGGSGSGLTQPQIMARTLGC